MSPPILYPYQRRYLADDARFKAGMWSRQTGKTFTTTLEAVLDVLEAETAGRVSRWTILSVSRDRALDAMDNGVKLHLRAIGQAFQALDEPLDVDELAHVVRIGQRGSYIRAVAAKPSTARGMSDNLILDEFAHHQDNRAIWTALLPVVSRPDLKLRVISTPNGRGDKFYEIMTAPDSLFSRHVVTIHDAVADGLPRNVDELKRAMADPIAWAQEFECQFVDEATAWLPYDLIDGCEDADAPGVYQGGPVYVGMDFAARGDLTVIAVLEQVGDVLWLRELIELRATSFAEQLATLDRVMRDYRVTRAALDQTGLGEMPVQEAQRRHGSYRVEGVLFSVARKLDMATALKERMEDKRLRLPVGNTTLRQDLHSVQRVAGPTGAPRLVAERSENGHADRFWAIALATAAAHQPRVPIEFKSAGQRVAAGLPYNSNWEGFYG
ncbi:phage terminase large subunit family protein [Gulbenkiania mobilis]|uniref:Phage FluMu gp28-like protein n=1 Tax=Gulbenkiania mobilis TaxID=397457 RepID=A0ABY2CZ46_GULMO|nr:phage FluMu gp28-like protein [Gulbenkiania mobilis]